MGDYDVIVIGAGPAGCQLGYFLEKAKRNYAILEASQHPGNFYNTMPKHRYLISLNKRFNGCPEPEFNMRHDWNSLITDEYKPLFRDYSDKLFPQADSLVKYVRDFVDMYGLNIKYNNRVICVDKEGDTFKIKTAGNDCYRAKAVVMALGACGPVIPKDIEGIELADSYEGHDINLDLYENKRVGIIGKGNSAFETADHLAGHAAFIHVFAKEPVKHAWHTHFVGDLRAVNNNIFDMYQLKSLHSILALSPTKISKNADGTFKVLLKEDGPHWKTPGSYTMEATYDYIIRACGWRYVKDEMFTDRTRPEMCAKNKYPQMNSNWESTTCENLFFAGTCMAGRDRKAASGFIHGFRYNCRVLFHLLEQRFKGVPLPAREFMITKGQELLDFATFVCKRFSTTDSLYQMQGYLGDCITFTGEGLQYQFELPLPYIEEKKKGKYFTCHLTYGFHKYPQHIQAVDFIRASEDRECGKSLHLIVKYFEDGELKDELEMDETLLVRYDELDFPVGAKNWQSQRNYLANFFNKFLKVTDEEYPIDSFGYEIFPWPSEKANKYLEIQKSQDTPCKMIHMFQQMKA